MKKVLLTYFLAVVLFPGLAAASDTGCVKGDCQDGSGTMEEWVAAQQQVSPKADDKARANWFKNWDKDKDGKISKKEFDTRKAWQKKQNAAKKKGQQGDAKGNKKGNKK